MALTNPRQRGVARPRKSFHLALACGGLVPGWQESPFTTRLENGLEQFGFTQDGDHAEVTLYFYLEVMDGRKINFDKLWDRHVITGKEAANSYVDQHYIHEVTSPQAFQGLRDAGRRLRRPDLTFGDNFDHNV